MRIVIDAYGGDNAPFEIIKGAALGARLTGADITLTGNEDKIKKIIAEHRITFNENLKICNCTDVISMEDEPTSILKEHRNCSMAVALDELANGNADALVSAGSTGALAVGGTLLIKRIKGVKRPAIGGFVPKFNGGYYMLLDMGANAECRPEMLLQFAQMASAYMTCAFNISSPAVAMLNIGTEDTKGDALRKETYTLLKNSELNFTGNIEARDMLTTECDIVVTDGFTGNIALKLIEGTASALFKKIKGVLYSNIFNKLAALTLKKDLYTLKKNVDSSEVGGALLLGIKKPVIKAHGNSDAKAISNAIVQAVNFVNNNIIEKMSQNLESTNTEGCNQ